MKIGPLFLKNYLLLLFPTCSSLNNTSAKLSETSIGLQFYSKVIPSKKCDYLSQILLFHVFIHKIVFNLDIHLVVAQKLQPIQVSGIAVFYVFGVSQ